MFKIIFLVLIISLPSFAAGFKKDDDQKLSRRASKVGTTFINLGRSISGTGLKKSSPPSEPSSPLSVQSEKESPTNASKPSFFSGIDTLEFRETTLGDKYEHLPDARLPIQVSEILNPYWSSLLLQPEGGKWKTLQEATLDHIAGKSVQDLSSLGMRILTDEEREKARTMTEKERQTIEEAQRQACAARIKKIEDTQVKRDEALRDLARIGDMFSYQDWRTRIAAAAYIGANFFKIDNPDAVVLKAVANADPYLVAWLFDSRAYQQKGDCSERKNLLNRALFSAKSYEVACELLRAGADIKARRPADDKSLLHIVMEDPEYDLRLARLYTCFSLRLRPLDCRDSNKETPLHSWARNVHRYATYQSLYERLGYLLQDESSYIYKLMKEKDCTGKTARDYLGKCPSDNPFVQKVIRYYDLQAEIHADIAAQYPAAFSNALVERMTS